MAAGKAAFPTRRAAAERNRAKILDAAGAAIAEGNTGISMAEIARRAGVGMATLYRNFPGRRELLEALYADEADAVCRAAVIHDGQTPGEALTAWLRLQFDFVSRKRLIVAELLEYAAGAPTSRRAQALTAGRPLLAAAQKAGQIRDDITLEQVFDMIIAIAKIQAPPDHLEPMIQIMLAGLAGHPRSHLSGQSAGSAAARTSRS